MAKGRKRTQAMVRAADREFTRGVASMVNDARRAVAGIMNNEELPSAIRLRAAQDIQDRFEKVRAREGDVETPTTTIRIVRDGPEESEETQGG